MEEIEGGLQGGVFNNEIKEEEKCVVTQAHDITIWACKMVWNQV